MIWLYLFLAFGPIAALAIGRVLRQAEADALAIQDDEER